MERKQVELAMSGLVLAFGILGSGGGLSSSSESVVTLRDLLQPRNAVSVSGSYNHARQQWMTADGQATRQVAATSSFDETDN
jgi:hypothetical protein